MTPPRDPDRLIRAFLDDGADLLPDQVFDAVRGEIHRTRQRTVVVPFGNASIVAVAAAVILLVGAGAYLLRPSLSAIVGGPAATLAPESSSDAVIPPSPATTPRSPSPSPVRCPHAYGGRCLGPLSAGTYRTAVLQTPLTYTVPNGWANDVDTAGNFQLLPPNASFEGVDAGTADYVSVADGVAAASADCEEHPQIGIDTTPAAIATFLAAQPGIAPTTPTPVTVGGLRGVVLDLELAEGYSAGCPYVGYEGVPMVPMLHHQAGGPAVLHNVLLPDNATRLYLLEGPHDRTIAIEVNDSPGNLPLDELDEVVQDFVFGE